MAAFHISWTIGQVHAWSVANWVVEPLMIVLVVVFLPFLRGVCWFDSVLLSDPTLLVKLVGPAGCATAHAQPELTHLGDMADMRHGCGTVTCRQWAAAGHNRWDGRDGRTGRSSHVARYRTESNSACLWEGMVAWLLIWLLVMILNPQDAYLESSFADRRRLLERFHCALSPVQATVVGLFSRGRTTVFHSSMLEGARVIRLHLVLKLIVRPSPNTVSFPPSTLPIQPET